MNGHWSKGKESKDYYKCDKCKKELKKGENRYIHIYIARGSSANENNAPRQCVDCYEKKISTEANDYISQVAQLWKDLGDKELDINDLKRIKKLENNIYQLLKKCKDIKDNFDDNSLIFTLENLETIPTDLKEHIKEYSSPQTQDKLKNKDKNCGHLLHGIEQHNGIYRCAYCWDSSSELFLKRLKNKGLSQNKNNQDSPLSNIIKKKVNNNSNNNKDNNNPNRERERESRKNDSPCLKDQREQNQSSIQQIQSEISQLENKPNKTEAEKADLKTKKEELERMNNLNSELANDKNNWIKPVLIIGGVILISGLIIYLISQKKKRN